MVSILEYVPEYSSQIQERDIRSRDEQTEDVKMNPGLVSAGELPARQLQDWVEGRHAGSVEWSYCGSWGSGGPGEALALQEETQPGLVLTWAVFSPSDRRTADCCSGPTAEGHLCHPASP